MAPSTTHNFDRGAARWPDKVQALLQAALALAGEHELESVLRQIVAGAASIADAEFAALGIYDVAGTLGPWAQ